MTWDNVAPALRALDPMLEAVAVGRFKPDCTRSSMFVGSRDLEAKFPCFPRAARTRRTGISPPRMRPSTQSWDLGSRWLGCEMRLGTSCLLRRGHISNAGERSPVLTPPAKACLKFCFRFVNNAAPMLKSSERQKTNKPVRHILVATDDTEWRVE